MGSVYAREQHGEDLRGLEQYEVVLSLERAVEKLETERVFVPRDTRYAPE